MSDPPREEPPGRRRAGSLPLAWAAIFLAGLLVRVLATFPAVRHPFESDVTLTGLTAFEILRGDLQVFLLNGVRNGALESYLHAAAFLLFGASRSTLYLAPLLAWALLLPVYGLFARELLGRHEALAAAFFLALPSPVVLELSYLPFGYVEMLLFTAAALWLACRVARLGPAPWSTLGFGVAVGLAWWCSAMSVMGTLPAALWIVLRRPGLARNARFLALAAAGLAIGALPWITFNIRYPLLSFRNDLAGWQGNFAFRPVGEAGQALENAARLAREHLPHLLVRPLCADPPLLAAARWLAGALYLLALLAALVRVVSRSSRSSRSPGGVDGARNLPPCLLPLLIVACGSALFVFSAAGSIPGDTSRYLLPIGLAVPLLLARSWSRLHGWKPAVAWTLAALLAACNLSGYSLPGRSCHREERRVAEAEDRLLGFLEEQRISWVFGGYWDVYSLNFLSHETIKAIPDLGWADYHGYQKTLGRAPARLALVGRRPGSARELAARAGLQGRVESIDGRFEIFLPIPNPPPEIDPQQLLPQLRQPAPLPMEACLSRLEITDGAAAGGLRVPAGDSRKLGLRVSHLGRGGSWFSTLELPGPERAVRIGLRWYREGAEIADLRAELPRTLSPGDAVDVELTLDPRTREGEPLPPGRYEVRIGLVQELVRWFRDAGDRELTLPVEVTGEDRRSGGLPARPGATPGSSRPPARSLRPPAPAPGLPPAPTRDAPGALPRQAR